MGKVFLKKGGFNLMKKFVPVVLLVLVLSQFAFAASVSDITAPVTKIYDLIKGVVSVVGIIAITIAGAMYMFSGSNIQSRENAKNMVSYAIVGLTLVWIAPIMVSYLTAPM
jgi:type IV secretory pathway VirB2 component (pilin)